MKVYRHNGPGGAVRAKDASEAAMILAKRQYGNWGGVESFRMISSKWLAHGEGWGEIGAKVWEALLVTVPSPMMLAEGIEGEPQDYVRRTRAVRISHRAAPDSVLEFRFASTPAERLPGRGQLPCLMHTRKNAGQ